MAGWGGVNGGIWGLELSKQRAGRNRSLPFPLGRRGLRWDPLSGHIQLRLFDGVLWSLEPKPPLPCSALLAPGFHPQSLPPIHSLVG